MGDRALIHFHDGETMGPTIYLHWGGSAVGGLIDQTRETMADRTGDVPYTTARFIAHACEQAPGNLSVGCWNSPGGDMAGSYERALPIVREGDYFYGDAGVFLIDCRDWGVECFGGYGLKTP